MLWSVAVLAACLSAILVLVVACPTVRDYGSRVLGKLSGSDTVAANPAPIRGADLSGSGPGSLVSAMTMPEFSRSSVGNTMMAARVVYRSTNGDSGEPTVVSGTVFTPMGSAPDGGWPVVAFGHGTVGINEPCAPSLANLLLGMSAWVSKLTEAGYAVAFADFQGLGAPGVHPYTDGKTAGLNMIDSVRALRHAFPNVSNRWAAIGGSQGGAAVWAADEQAATYAPELELVGAVALAPAADVTGLVDKAQAATLTHEQVPALQLIIESLARLHPDINRDDYRRGVAAAQWDALSACSGPEVHNREAAVNALGPGDLAPRTPEAADRLRKYLAQWALPQQRLSAPLSVVYGEKDEYIDTEWTTAAISRACRLGGTVVWDLQPGKGHGDLDVGNELDWLKDRFQGKPVTSECK